MSPSQRRTVENNPIDIKRYLRLILRNWYWFLISMTIAVSISYIVNVVTLPQYAASCNVVIGDDPSSSMVSQNMVGTMTFNQANPINKEIGIIKSKHLALETISELDFDIDYYQII